MKRYIKSDIEIPSLPLLGGDYRFTIPFECHPIYLIKDPKPISFYIKQIFDLLPYYDPTANTKDIDEILIPTNLQSMDELIYAKLLRSSSEAIMGCLSILDDTIQVVSYEEPIIRTLSKRRSTMCDDSFI